MSWFIFFAELLHAFSLSDGIQIALQHNKEVEMAEVKFEIAKSKLGEAFGNYLPNVSGSWQVGKQKNKVQGEPSDPSTNQNTKTISVEQKLFNGFQSFYQSESAGHLIKAAHADLIQTKAGIAYSAVEAYVNVYVAQKALAIEEKNLVIAKDALTKVNERLRLKVIAKNEAAHYESEHFECFSNVVEAKKELFKSQVAFNSIIGQENVDFKDLEVPEVTFNMKEKLSNLTSSNQTLQKLFFLKKSSRAELAKSRGALLPKVSFIGEVKHQDDVLYLGNKDIISKQYYINVSVPIFQGGQRFVKIIDAQDKYALSEKEYEIGLENIQKDLKSSIQTYAFSQDLLQSYKQLKQMATNRVDRLKYQLKLRAIDKLSVYTAEQELNRLDLRILLLKQELILNYYNVLLLSGSTFWYDNNET